MNHIALIDRQILLDGQTIPLISGEVHYWRLQPHYWQKCLQRVGEMGIKIIASYVCWDFHEYEKEKLDFTGETLPERNLTRFLDLCQSMDLRVIIRPGPYIYSEWTNSGVPERVAQFHRLHPEFLKAASVYINQVTGTLRPYFVSHGGPIILLQADNEMDPFVHNYGEQLGIYGGNGLFQEFLREKYRTIDELNQSWGASLNDFSETTATVRAKGMNPFFKKRMLDYREFHHWSARKIARWVVDAYREAGVTIPIYLNTIYNCISQNWREMADEFELYGIDIYPANEFNSHGTEHLEFFRNVSYASAVTKLSYIAEFECGIWHGHHYHTGNFSANHYRMACLSALMGGIVGWNWYMLVERDNWYNSPINSRGMKRPELFAPLKKIVDIFHYLNPAALNKLTSTAVTDDESHFWAESMGHQNTVIQAVYESGIPFRSYDILKNAQECKLLFYAGPEWLSRKRQQQLNRFVQDGGILVCFSTFPCFDENFVPYSAFSFAPPDGSTPVKRFDLDFGAIKVSIKESVFFFREVKAECIFAYQSAVKLGDIFAEEIEFHENLEAGKKLTIGYRQSIGKGKLIFLGCSPNPEIVRAIHQFENIPISCQTHISDVQTALFQKILNHYFLIIVNNGKANRDVRVELAAAIFANSTWEMNDLFQSHRSIIEFTVRPEIVISLEAKDGTIVEFKRLTS